MVFLCVAAYEQAAPFIKKLNLKKDLKYHKFQVFENENTVLLIMGTGKINAAIAVTYLFSQYEPNSTDILVNIGTCVCLDKDNEISKTFFCNKVIEYGTNQTFYPDMLYNHPFEESSIETMSYVINKEDEKKLSNIKGKLLDVEASAVFEAASVFMQPHQISFIKIVSDYPNSTLEGKEALTKLIENNADTIIEWFNEIRKTNENIVIESKIITDREESGINIIARNLRLSSAMKSNLIDKLIYYKLKYGSIYEILDAYINVECKSKHEGKEYFAELESKLI